MPGGRKSSDPWTSAGFWFAAALAVSLHPVGRAEGGSPPAPDRPTVHELPSRFPDKPSIAPSWSIPIEPFGFAAPGQNFLGMRNTMASLDFLGEDRLLFTFRVPGLMQREPGSTAEDQRQIRALVLRLPTGAVQSQADWTLHDRSRYVWSLDDDHFLLRDRNTIFEGNTALIREPLLQFPGPLVSIQLNPGRQFIVTNSQEPAQSASRTGSTATASSNTGSASSESESTSDLVLRILNRESKKVLLVTHIRNAIDLPLNGEGFLTTERGDGVEWNVNLNYFSGPNRTLSKVKSACNPDLGFLSESVALVTACSDSGSDALLGLTTAGTTLWTDLVNDRQVWPLIATSRSGLRFARETLYVSHSINAFSPLGNEDVKGQWVRVFDAATGNIAFESPATPILDAGGNVAISPSGRRVAIINAGAIQVFELPSPPALPSTSAVPPAH